MGKSIQLLLTLSVLIYAVHCQQTIVDVSTEAWCTQSAVLKPDCNSAWASAGLDVYVDTFLLCGDIIAFKLQWFNGCWSDWFVVGVNDIDCKSDGPSFTLKRYWSYFADHNHQYIICYQNKYKGCKCQPKAGIDATTLNVTAVQLAVNNAKETAASDPEYAQQVDPDVVSDLGLGGDPNNSKRKRYIPSY